MNCRDVQGLISPYIDHQLNEEELKDFLEHINRCPSCREELELTQTLMESLSTLEEEVEVPEGFHEDLMDRLQSYQVMNNKTKKRFPFRYVASIAAVFVLVASLGVMNGLWNNSSKVQMMPEIHQAPSSSRANDDTDEKQEEKPEISILETPSDPLGTGVATPEATPDATPEEEDSNDIAIQFKEGQAKGESLAAAPLATSADDVEYSNSTAWVYVLVIFVLLIIISSTTILYIRRRRLYDKNQ